MKQAKSFISLLMALVLTVTSLGLTACNKTYEYDWEATESEYIELDIDVAKSDGHYTVTLTHDSDVFATDLPNEAIKIEATYLNETESSEEDPEQSYTEDTVTEFQIQRESGKQLVLTFDATADYRLMKVGVHKSVMSNNLYGDALWQEGEEILLSYSASIDGEFNAYDRDPTLKIVLENTTCADNLSIEMLALDGAFEDLTVTNVAGNDHHLTVTTNGTINDKTAHGKVTLKAEATACGEAMEAFTTVKTVGAAVIPESYSLVNGNFEFKVELGNMTFTADPDAVAAAIAVDGQKINVKDVGTDFAVLSIATAAATVDEALADFADLSFSIGGSVLSTGKDVELFILATSAELNFMVDYISPEEELYRAEGILYVLYGDLTELTAADLTFDGNFADATVENLTRNENHYEVTFTFAAPHAEFDHENCELNGTLSVSEGKIKNVWGSDAERTCSFSYIYTDMAREVGDAAEAIAEASAAGQLITSLTKLGTVASKISGVASAVTGVKSVLELAGVLESTDSKVDKLRVAVAQVIQKMDELNVKIDALGNRVQSSIGDVSDQLDKTTYVIASGSWNDYMKNDVGKLNEIYARYSEKYRLNLVKFLNDPDNTEIKIYIDSNGNVTLPRISPTYSADGIEITEIYTYKGNAQEVKALTAEMIKNSTFDKNRRTLYQGFDKDIENAFNNRELLVYVGTDKKSNDNISPDSLTATQLYYALTTYFAKAALEEVGPDNVLDAYKNFCYQLGNKDKTTSGVLAGMSKIDYFHLMITLYYNFYSEAEGDIELMRTYLNGISTNTHDFALLAQEYTTQSTTVSDATEAFKDALYKKVKGDGVAFEPSSSEHDVSITNWHYSFVTGSNVLTKPVKPDDRWTDAPWIYCPSANEAMSEKQIRIIYNRYKVLKEAGISQAEDFFSYLCGNKTKKILSLTKDSKLIAIKSVSSSFEPDGTLELYAENVGLEDMGHYMKNEGANYFAAWYPNRIDCSGKREKEYYSNLKRIDTTFIDLNGKVETSLTFASGKYDERHGRWINDEIWKFFGNFKEEGGIYLLKY